MGAESNLKKLLRTLEQAKEELGGVRDGLSKLSAETEDKGRKKYTLYLLAKVKFVEEKLL